MPQLIDDMNMRRFSRMTQRNYQHAMKPISFGVFSKKGRMREATTPRLSIAMNIGNRSRSAARPTT
ncbi:hypothetical protein [Pararhizobium sp. DWP3-4]|uniref:hypothetical protein n=1 Tax=Pararhizobium sp. DWP3-4 TaxID=2804565 RepID=UPI003CFACFF3